MKKPNPEKKSKQPKNRLREFSIEAPRIVFSSMLIASFTSLFGGQAYAETSYNRLSSLLASVPEGGWVKASTNIFSEAWPTGADAVPETLGWTGNVVSAWSSFAWDSTRGNLILWGGGHANYSGNEVYVWDGGTGKWGRGSLPTRIDVPTGFVVDPTTPQSSHTY